MRPPGLASKRPLPTRALGNSRRPWLERLHLQEGLPLCHFHELEDATHFCEPCPVSRWHAQAREHLALPEPSLAKHLKTVCGNPSRPPGLNASTLWMLWILQRENTETERLASLGRLQPIARFLPPSMSFLLQGWAGNPFLPAQMPRNREAANPLSNTMNGMMPG